MKNLCLKKAMYLISIVTVLSMIIMLPAPAKADTADVIEINQEQSTVYSMTADEDKEASEAQLETNVIDEQNDDTEDLQSVSQDVLVFPTDTVCGSTDNSEDLVMPSDTDEIFSPETDNNEDEEDEASYEASHETSHEADTMERQDEEATEPGDDERLNLDESDLTEPVQMKTFSAETVGDNTDPGRMEMIKPAAVSRLTFGRNAASTDGETPSGWQNEDGNTYYYNEEGERLTGLQEIDGSYYYFDQDSCVLYLGFFQIWDDLEGCYTAYYADDVNGSLRTNQWYSNGYETYYFGDEGRAKTGFQTIGESSYYFDSQGIMATGIQQIDGNTYRFREDGVMVTGWYKTEDGGWYYKSDGTQVSGWQKIDGIWYYFWDSSWADGRMATGQQYIDGYTYRFREDGAMLTGWYQNGNGSWEYYKLDGSQATDEWEQVNGVWYFFDLGIMVTGRYDIGGYTYRFREDGAMLTGWYKTGSGYWEYYKPDGTMARNEWEQVNGIWYYFDYWNMVTGEQYIDGNYYRFRGDGSMLTGWYKTEYSRWEYYKPDGRGAYNEWQKIGGKWYYFSGSSMVTGEKYIDGNYYRFRGDGAMLTGWYKTEYGDYWEYYKPDGRRACDEWQKIGGKWYYFQYSTMVSDRILVINGSGYQFSKSGAMMHENTVGWIKTLDANGNIQNWYYVNKGGSLAVGWKMIGGKWYYFSLYDCTMHSGYSYPHEIDGKEYVFDKNGALLGASGGWVRIGYQKWSQDYSYYSYNYYTNNGGDLRKGWQQIGGKWYYFDAYDCEMYRNGTYMINQKQYRFDRNGVWVG